MSREEHTLSEDRRNHAAQVLYEAYIADRAYSAPCWGELPAAERLRWRRVVDEAFHMSSRRHT